MSTVPVSEPPPAADRPAAPRRVLLVGVTGYAREHLRILLDWHDAGRAQFAGAVVVNPQEAETALSQLAARGTPVFGSLGAALAEVSPELVLLPTPIHLHRSMTEAALRAGADVLVEKPVAGNLADADAMAAVAAATGRKLLVGFQEYSTESTRRIRRALASGAIGRVLSVHGFGLWPRPATYYARARWAGRIELDGVAVADSPLQNALAHFVHLALHLAHPDVLGVADLVEAEGELVRVQAIENHDTAAFRGRTAEGVTVSFAATHSCAVTVNPVLVVRGTRGTYRWEHTVGGRLVRADGRVETWEDDENGAKRDRLFESVERSLAGSDVDPACDIVRARPHARLIDALQSSVPITVLDPALARTIPSPKSPADTLRHVPGLGGAVRRAGLRGIPLAAAGTIPGLPGPTPLRFRP